MHRLKRVPLFLLSAALWVNMGVLNGCSTNTVLRGTANVASPLIPDIVDNVMKSIDTSYG